VPYEQRDLYDAHATKPYLYHATVEPLTTAQHGNS
jgi:hypothetical protein